MHEEGYEVLAIEQAENSMMLQNFRPEKDKKYALIFGNEVNGVDDEVMKMVDGCIEIPQFGTKHSFNIVVSMGIVGWDFYSKMKLY
ncbi:tRNA (guanosine(18)-2'-O)-methyltransferase [compost metagenome]